MRSRGAILAAAVAGGIGVAASVAAATVWSGLLIAAAALVTFASRCLRQLLWYHFTSCKYLFTIKRLQVLSSTMNAPS